MARGRQVQNSGFNWLSLVPRLHGARRELLEDFVERVVRIADAHAPGLNNVTDDVYDLLEELREEI